MRSITDTVVDALPRVGVGLGLVLVGYGLSRLVRWGARRWLARRRTPSFATVMSKLAGWLVLTLAVLFAVTAVFPSVRPVDVLAGLGFFSLAVGFAFQDILENTLSGVLLLFRQPFRSGDQIRVRDQMGTVEAITIRETRITTFDGELVVIPNRDVYKDVIVVQTHNDLRRLTFVVGIAFENDPVEACRVITDALSTVPGIEQHPPPEALICRLSSSTVDLRVGLWCSSHQYPGLVVLHDAIAATKAALDDAGIEMPADILALQATPSFRAAIQGDGDVTPGGGLRR